MSNDQTTEKYVIVFDTMCVGWQAVMDDKDNPVLFDSKEEAEKEIREFVDDWNKHCEKDCEYEYEDYRVMKGKVSS